MEILDKEIVTYEAHKNELLGSARGKYALVKEEKIIGVFDTPGDAIHEGYIEFGSDAFLVKEIVDVDAPQNFTSNLIAV